MKLLVGLGNPGKKYENTRHNVGFIVLNAMALKFSTRLPDGQVSNFQFSNKFKALIFKYKANLFAKPQTFMNDSGVAVKNLSTHYNLQHTNLYVVHDDLDLTLGSYKIQFGKGPKVHNGLLSIEEELGTSDFWRVRIGVDNRDPNNRIPGDEYVLQNFTKEEIEIRDKIIAEITIKLFKLLAEK
ncbi:aminoacyl-tRNA hydrolase [Candidatus Woesebacteria bacterium RIFCSPHIGHO2_02_FULL_38_9]|uniref:Peptidyl-tRNA hydrolase n=1 Tax=Candidatus Woesebacteria bacterium RIFCSPHIGHO2_01_FULL_39_28 TaxID=1802496 RepID=A0A1F7YIK9_9BACT|nr:MAG: aminoacyl-tRNA hydrolase [Candidatus Woesebacteria bacterium RIFCSPHIGHO2_01_FULL_39_28]OGM34695.1 MAG: aminoacyl-tRNA hydrolase [Candidatus Woesebacteria bacterium RIFCSPHIGHO2_02_FULL_38_9]OGM58667.1 MAG: aminoacyl-tRNA hydrolase [Candidatus Woesebacteria bacterium RIFCSPLOWO2_01_FULL_38_20]